MPSDGNATGDLLRLCLAFFTTSQLRHHKVREAQVWWLNLIIELATVGVIHVQKNIKITI